jgi:lipoic acid synthetase
MKGKPGPVDPLEPQHVADAIEKLRLHYAVITSVDRDDLPDEGAGHFAQVITAVRERMPACRIEVLIPDFNGKRELLEIVLDARPDCLAHNIETASHLYRRVRPVAVYENTLKILEQSVLYREKHACDIHVKCGIMVGLGETMDQLLDTIKTSLTGCGISLLPPARPLLRSGSRTSGTGAQMGLKHVESGRWLQL